MFHDAKRVREELRKTRFMHVLTPGFEYTCDLFQPKGIPTVSIAIANPSKSVPNVRRIKPAANRILRDHGGPLGLSPDFTILDSEDSADLLASCVASTQTVAYLAGFGANLGIWSVDRLGSAGGPWGDALGEALSVQRRMASFNSGIVHPADVVYLASWILLAVFLAGRALEARRWS